jgi:hypothetical protein
LSKAIRLLNPSGPPIASALTHTHKHPARYTLNVLTQQQQATKKKCIHFLVQTMEGNSAK